MKIFRICPEPPYLRKFRKFHQDRLRGKPYAQQMDFYRRENVVLPGGWAAGMEAQGFEVFETVFGDSPLQARWAIENGHADLISQTIMQQLVLKQMIQTFDPDVIFVYAGAFFRLPPEFREELRQCCRKTVLLAGMWGDELPSGLTYRDYFQGVDFMFCSSSVYERKFTEAGIPALTIGNCFDNTIPYTRPQHKEHRFVFSGTTGYGYPDHVGRYEKLREFMHKSDLTIWANEPNLFASKVRKFPLNSRIQVLNTLAQLPAILVRLLRRMIPIARLRRLLLSIHWIQDAEVGAHVLYMTKNTHPMHFYFDSGRVKPLRKLFPQRVHKLLMNTSDYYALVEGSEMVLNLHRDEEADIGNIRCYEVTGLGSLLVTDRGEALREFLEPDVDFIAFETVEECIRKINHLRAHPEEMRRIAANGQAKTLARHTVAHRCRQIADTLRDLSSDPTLRIGRRPRIVDATYNLDHHPISYDIAFFLQAADIYRKQMKADFLRITILWPEDIENVPGVSAKSNAVVDASARAFRINHICAQMAELMPSAGVINIRRPSLEIPPPLSQSLAVLPFPAERDHHTAYYRRVAANPKLLNGFSASSDAHRYIQRWLEPLRRGRKVVTITLRQYQYDTERNSNIDAWSKFASRLGADEYAVVIVPDTDHIEDFKRCKLKKYPSFEPACFDVDLRLALYERAFLNMFINNGPSVAATLDKKVNYLMFKIVTPSVPHCTEEFITWSGFEVGKTPAYAGPYQKWVWEEDTAEVIWREFVRMSDRILIGMQFEQQAAVAE